MQPGIMHQHLRHAGDEYGGQGLGGGGKIAEVEGHRLGGMAFAAQLLRQHPRAFNAAMGVDHHVQAVLRQAAADGGADRAAAAGDERAPHGAVGQAMTARPVSSAPPVSALSFRS